MASVQIHSSAAAARANYDVPCGNVSNYYMLAHGFNSGLCDAVLTLYTRFLHVLNHTTA